MKPQSLLVKIAVRILYLAIFVGISIGLTYLVLLIASKGVGYLSQFGVNLYWPGILLVFAVFFFLLIYSYWLAKEASITFADYNYMFLESIWISMVKSKLYLAFIPVIGKFFDKPQPEDSFVQ